MFLNGAFRAVCAAHDPLMAIYLPFAEIIAPAWRTI